MTVDASASAGSPVPAASAGPVASVPPVAAAPSVPPGASGPPAAPVAPVAPVPPVTPLTERQEARRQRILRATQQLAARGGFDAVQMREVAELSEVALGTLYRYFPSKIHLLVATMQDQLEQLHDQLRRKPPVSADAGERVAETLMRTFKALQREPHLAEAMMRALTFADRSVSAEVDSVNRLITDVIADAVHAGRQLTRSELAAVRVVTHTWHSTLITWLSGRASISQVKADIDTACTLISQAAGE